MVFWEGQAYCPDLSPTTCTQDWWRPGLAPLTHNTTQDWWCQVAGYLLTSESRRASDCGPLAVLQLKQMQINLHYYTSYVLRPKYKAVKSYGKDTGICSIFAPQYCWVKHLALHIWKLMHQFKSKYGTQGTWPSSTMVQGQCKFQYLPCLELSQSPPPPDWFIAAIKHALIISQDPTEVATGTVFTVSENL